MHTTRTSTRKRPFRMPAKLDEPIGAVELSIEVELRDKGGELTYHDGVGSTIFGNSDWELEVIWNAVQVLEQDFGAKRSETLDAVRRVLERLSSPDQQQ